MSLTPGTKRLLADEGAFQAFIDQWRNLWFSEALKITGDLSIAEEVVQESILKFWTKLPVITDDRCLEGYVARTVRNKSIDIYRHHAKFCDRSSRPRYRGFESQGSGDLSEFDHADVEPDPVNIEELALRRENVERVRRVLDLMLPAFREVLYWQFYCGLTPIEVAERLGETRSCIKSRFLRARRAFAATWRMEYGEAA